MRSRKVDSGCGLSRSLPGCRKNPPTFLASHATFLVAVLDREMRSSFSVIQAGPLPELDEAGPVIRMLPPFAFQHCKFSLAQSFAAALSILESGVICGA